LVKIHNFSQNQNKFGYAYLLTPTWISEKALLTGSFLKRKLQEYEALKAEIKALKLEIETDNCHNHNHKPTNTWAAYQTCLMSNLQLLA
jgi:hypothetical protein